MISVPFSSVRSASVTAIAVAILMLPVSAFSQDTAEITGRVTDSSGGVMPGVTVEATSPALIEKVRTTMTDTDGRYRIINLRPGTYAVTFTLVGFNAFKREGIDLSAAFTAVINAEMRVGSIEESITVSGQAPVVDTQSILRQQVIQRDVMDSLPAAKTFASYAVLIPGMTVSAPDVGGAYGDLSASLAIHGSRLGESQIDMDGMSVRNGQGMGGGMYGQFLNNGMMQEISVSTGGMSAEQESGGVRSNVIPREGGNQFQGILTANYTNSKMNSRNVSDDERARGLNANNVGRIYDVNPSAGGRIIRNKLWFFLSFREWGTRTTRAGRDGVSFQNATPNSKNYTPDLSRQAFDHTWHLSASNRMTWQASPRNKINLLYEGQNHEYEFPTNSIGNAPETRLLYQEKLQYLAQASWSSPVTSKLLFEAGWTLAANNWITQPEPEVIRGLPAITELSTNFAYRAAPAGNYGQHRSNNYNYRASATYITGSHSLKGGLTFMNTWGWETQEPNAPVSYRFRNGIPESLVQFATPISYMEKVKYNAGLFVQDRWTVSRLTLNLGVRADFFNAYIEAQSLPAGLFVPARNFDRVDNVPNWTDIAPRLGVSYDLFGNQRTAVKTTLGRYMGGVGLTTFTRFANPMYASVLSATRTWHDDNGNFLPDCDLANLAPNRECERIGNANFGNTVPVTRYANDVSEGFGVRPDSWEFSTSIQHEVVRGVSANVGYFRRWYGRQTLTQNLAVSNSDFSTFCVTSPVDARLPGGGGQSLCGFYDVNPSGFGKFDNLIVHASDFGDRKEIYDGVDLSGQARLPSGVTMSGGVTLGRTRIDNCYALSNLSLEFTATAPRTTPFCDVRPPFQPNGKFLVVYPLPWWGLQASATVQSVPGPQITAEYSASARDITGLGRSLSVSSVLVDLIPPGTLYGERQNQTDVRLAKNFAIGRARLQGQFDLYNAFNAGPALRIQTRYGSSWQDPTQTLIGRLAKVGLQINF